MNRVVWILILMIASPAVPCAAQEDDLQLRITRALMAAPESMREGATVLGTGRDARPGDVLAVLRQGTNGLVCLADDPARQDFHVSCYHESLDPYMRLGRSLRAEGLDRSAVMDARYAALEAGEFSMPSSAVLYSLTADAAPEGGDAGEGLRRLTVVYVPGATQESTGLPGRPEAGLPWLMLPGTPWAHIMISD